MSELATVEYTNAAQTIMKMDRVPEPFCFLINHLCLIVLIPKQKTLVRLSLALLALQILSLIHI